MSILGGDTIGLGSQGQMKPDCRRIALPKTMERLQSTQVRLKEEHIEKLTIFIQPYVE